MKHTMAAILFLSLSYNVDATIHHLFIDVNILLETCTKAATKEVGLWDITKYTAYMGKAPNKADFFKSLKNCPAQSTLQTYNEDIAMPLILSDWFIGLEKNSVIKSKILTYLDKHPGMSNIEKTIFKNIANMMLTPAVFIGTQLLKKDIVKIIQKLQKSMVYSVHIIGNLDKESEPLLIKLLQAQFIADSSHCIFSNRLQQLKPHDGYYNALIDYCKFDPKECLVVDIEKKHVQGAKNAGMSSILIQGQSASQLKNELSRHNIQV